MQPQRTVFTALMFFLSCLAASIAQEGSSITWESYKEAEFDFGDQLLRVGSEYQTYSWAVDASTGWTSSYGPEFTEITSPMTTEFTNSQASSPRATASAVAGWLLDKDDNSGIATLSNAAAGTTTIIGQYDPTATAMSWAAQSTSLELGEEVSQGQIDWSPGILVSASGGSFISAYDSVVIHDPIVVWTREANSDVVSPSTLFEFTAQFDSKTEIHWNEVRAIQTGILGEPEFVPVPNDGPFLDARVGGSGSFRLRLESDLLPADKRGTLAVDFANGIVTTSTATGVFSDLAPREDALGTTLPDIGEAAIIESILVDNDDTNGRFALGVDVGQDRVISDVAACSDGVHISVGPAVDTIQTFTLNPMQRSPIGQVNAIAGDAGLSGACLGALRDDAELLFGNPFTSAKTSLQREFRANPVDRFLRFAADPEARQQTIVFDRGENASPADTRRWTVEFDARLLQFPGPISIVESVEEVHLGDVGNKVGDREISQPGNGSLFGAIGATGGEGQPEDAAGTGEVLDVIDAGFAIGLLDLGTYGDAPAVEGEVFSVDGQEISLFRQTDGVDLRVIEQPDVTLVRMVVDGLVVAKQNIPAQDLRSLFDDAAEDGWQHFKLGLEQRHAGLGIQLEMVSRDRNATLPVFDRTIPGMELSPEGYRLAVGSLLNREDLAHDFDNLMTTFQNTGDVAWDGRINVADFRLLRKAIESEVMASVFDLDLNGSIDLADLEIVEDLIPNKLPGDTNLDGLVSFADFLVLADFFGESTGLWSRGDFDSNGRVTFKDFVLLAHNFGLGGDGNAGTSQPVPEPMSVTLLLWGVFVLGRRWVTRTSPNC